MPMGLRSAAYVCQRVTNTIKYIHHTWRYWSINYLDDFGGAKMHSNAIDSFQELRAILQEVGATEAEEKAVEMTEEYAAVCFDNGAITDTVHRDYFTVQADLMEQ